MYIESYMIKHEIKCVNMTIVYKKDKFVDLKCLNLYNF